MHDIFSPTACREKIAAHIEKVLVGMADGPDRDRLVRALAKLDQKIEQGKQEMLNGDPDV